MDNDNNEINIVNLRGVGSNNPIINMIYDDRVNMLNKWRNRYSKSEYPGKVALNTVYQLLTLNEMWGYILKCFDQGKVYDDFQTANDVVQRKSGEIALSKFVNEAETKLNEGKTLAKLDINNLNKLVSKARLGDNDSVHLVELIYIWFTGATELSYAYASFGLMGLSKIESLQQISSIIIGGDVDVLENAITVFGNNIEMCYKKLPNLF